MMCEIMLVKWVQQADEGSPDETKDGRKAYVYVVKKK